MDIKAKIEELVAKIKVDSALLSKFKSSPVSTVESLLGVDLPDEQVKKIVDGVKTKLNLDKIGDSVSGVVDKIGGIFKK